MQGHRLSGRRRAGFLALLTAAAGLALTPVASAFLRADSLSAVQPDGIGPVRVHFLLCADGAEEQESACGERRAEAELQYLLGIAVAPGSSAPATITATPTGGGAPVVFTRADRVAAQIAAGTAALHAAQPREFEAWPPDGLEGIGYLSGVVTETKGPPVELPVDADFGLPNPAGGAAFLGPFTASTALGVRTVSPEAPADRPPRCSTTEAEEEDPDFAYCLSSEEEVEVDTSDLRIGAVASTAANPGGKASLRFDYSFASTAESLPRFDVSAASTLAGAGVVVSDPSFTPPEPDENTDRSSGSETLTVNVPGSAQPGVYEVTITATTPQGASATQTGKFEVTRPRLRVGRVSLNKRNGTAKLSIEVPSAGTLAVSGKSIAKVQRKAPGPKTLKVTIRARGKSKANLRTIGKANVKAKIAFKPSDGASVTRTKSIALKKKLAG